MKIEKVVDRELTLEEIQSIKTFRKYTDGTSFACLRSRVMVIVDDVPATDVDAIKERALEHMRTALSVQPDFTVYRMDDGHILLGMYPELYAFSKYCSRESMYLNLSLRTECLDAAEEGEIIAIAYEED